MVKVSNISLKKNVKKSSLPKVKSEKVAQYSEIAALWVLRGRSLCVPGVSPTGVLPHLVPDLPQMVGLLSSHVEDITLIRCAFTWHPDTGLLQHFCSSKVVALPSINVKNICSDTLTE